MIDKGRRKMNGIEEYITREITQKGWGGGGGQPGGRGRLRDGGKAPGTREELEILVLGRDGPFSLDPLGRPILYIFPFPLFRTSRRFIRAQLLDPFSTNSL